jgi:hypothetical protein
VDFFDNKTNGEFNGTLTCDVYNAIHDLEVMPSMRALMSAGPALERENLAGFNCFVGETQFLTKDGVKRFDECVGTTQKVLAGDGVWRDAKVNMFGQQQIYKVVLRPGSRSRTKIRHTVYVTHDHRWLTQRGEVTDLRAGDTVPFNAPVEPDFNPSDFIRGFGFGDGTLDTRGRARVRLCGAKQKYLDVIEQHGNCSIMNPPSHNGDPLVVFHKGHFQDWKQLPETPSYWWLQGYIAADGHCDPVQPGLSTQDREAADYIMSHSTYGGVAVTGWNEMDNITNYGKRSSPLIRLGLRSEMDFRVMSVEQMDVKAAVYCVTEPVTKQFTLANGVLTGNCSYLAVNTKRSFAEALYILMCGTGVGFSCERQEITHLPPIPDVITPTDDIISVADSKRGWAKAYHSLLNHLWNGDEPKIDYTKVRHAGESLKVFGGRASGPAPLERLFKFTVITFNNAKGRKLNSLEVHDLMCMIGEIVVVGGVRRSALISLSNLSDQRMRDAKSGQWWADNPQRGLANNSVAYTEKPDIEIFMEEWLSLVKSKSGERGIFNREAAGKQAAKWGRRSAELNYGCNPCCFTGDMKLLTNKGYEKFSVLNHQSSVRVVSSDGTITEGKVWSSGIKDIVNVSFHPRTGRSPIECTPDHIFQLNDGTECQAVDLTGKRVKIYADYESTESVLSGLVCSVKSAGTAEVFDFTEPKNHWGVVEGVVVHNSEIILRDKQLCNLSEVIVREDDTIDTLMKKVEVATILGTLQATLTDFNFVSESWAKNTAEESLLGVSLTGIMDNNMMSTPGDELTSTLNQLRDHAREVNKVWSEKLGINASTAITCVKPSGTVSQLCNTASGIHARHNQNYIRTVRVDKKDPLYHFMISKGFHTEDDVMRPDNTAVVSFAVKAPESSVTRDEVNAMEALELWLTYQREWCEHKPSVTITVKDDEWLEVGTWVYKHFDEVSGISFLPHTDHTYQQAPYQDLTVEEFDQWILDHPTPDVDWTELNEFEKTDNTVSMQTLACVAGNCEI